ncbi:acyltransferase [Blautia pseudococcoides]|uniref:acyltransferase n=1 Tax=Blautia pseudococcoides TaxID=1796616 RepID=UPI001FADBD60|nr:acyltransferase [Blautia pseudococcoides]
MNTRYFLMLRMFFMRSPMKRADYMRKKGVFHSMGEKVMITSRKIPLYSRLISIGNNVWMASGVSFITHDVCHFMLNGWKKWDEARFEEKIGCIEIGDNVFIGSDVLILYDVKVGNNVVIAAGSLVNRDVPDNSIVGGVPARVIGNFEDFAEKRRMFHIESPANNAKQFVSQECEDLMWELFHRGRM